MKTFKINQPLKKIKPEEDREDREHGVLSNKKNNDEKCNQNFEKYIKKDLTRVNAR